MTLDAALLRSLLDYDSGTGIFTWKVRRNLPVGSEAGYIDAHGYRYIGIATAGKKKRYYAHRLAWLYVHGTWPVEQIDHRNHDKADNRICNLREATASQNLANRRMRPSSRSGLKGVYAKRNKWTAQIQMNKKKVWLGDYDTPQAAHAAYARAAAALHGDFANCN